MVWSLECVDHPLLKVLWYIDIAFPMPTWPTSIFYDFFTSWEVLFVPTGSRVFHMSGIFMRYDAREVFRSQAHWNGWLVDVGYCSHNETNSDVAQVLPVLEMLNWCIYVYWCLEVWGNLYYMNNFGHWDGGPRLVHAGCSANCNCHQAPKRLHSWALARDKRFGWLREAL